MEQPVSDALLKRLISVADDAILCVDDEMRITFFNQGAERIFGYKAEEILGNPLGWLLPADEAAYHDERIRRFGRSGDVSRPMADRNDVSGKHADGSIFPAQVSIIRGESGTPTAYAAILRDVSVHRAFQQNLIDSLDQRIQLTAAINASEASISISDITRPDLPLTYVSDGFERLTGYSKDEVLGRNCNFLQGVDTDYGAVRMIRHAIRAHAPTTVTLLNYRKDGTPFWNQLTLSPVTAPDGSVSSYVGVQVNVGKAKTMARATGR